MPVIDIDLARPWPEIFALVAQQKAEKKHDEQQAAMMEAVDRQDREKKQADERRERKEKEEAATERMRATAEQVAALCTRLDDMDAATVHALMENSEALDRVNAELKDILDRAYVLPDGRRVFKDDAGRRVFDEHGVELPPGTIDPAMIEDSRPRVGLLLAKRDEQLRLEASRHELHDFQTELDQTRARLDHENATTKDIETMQSKLEAAMPEAARAKLGQHAGESDAPKAHAAVEAAPLALNLDDALRAAVPQPLTM